MAFKDIEIDGSIYASDYDLILRKLQLRSFCTVIPQNSRYL